MAIRKSTKEQTSDVANDLLTYIRFIRCYCNMLIKDPTNMSTLTYNTV